MGWREIVSAELGIVIITAENCAHCIELEAMLNEEPLDVPSVWIDKSEGDELFAEVPLFAASIDVLPCAGIFSRGEGKVAVRAATPERIKEALSSL